MDSGVIALRKWPLHQDGGGHDQGYEHKNCQQHPVNDKRQLLPLKSHGFSHVLFSLARLVVFDRVADLGENFGEVVFQCTRCLVVWGGENWLVVLMLFRKMVFADIVFRLHFVRVVHGLSVKVAATRPNAVLLRRKHCLERISQKLIKNVNNTSFK